MSDCQSAHISADPTGLISVKFNIEDFYETVEIIQIWLETDKNIRHFTWRAKCVLCCWHRHVQHNNKYSALLYCYSKTVNIYVVNSNVFVSTTQKEHHVALPWQQRLCKCTIVLCYTYIAYLVDCQTPRNFR